MAPGASVIAMNTVSLPLEYTARLVRFAREFDLRDVAERDATIAVLTHDDCGESLRIFEIGLRIDARAHVLTARGAGGRDVVVAADRVVHVHRRDAERRHLRGVQPDAHREVAAAEHACLAHSLHRGEHRLDEAHRVVRALLHAHLFGEQRHVHHRVAAGAVADDRIFDVARQFVTRFIHLG